MELIDTTPMASVYIPSKFKFFTLFWFYGWQKETKSTQDPKSAKVTTRPGMGELYF